MATGVWVPRTAIRGHGTIHRSEPDVNLSVLLKLGVVVHGDRSDHVTDEAVAEKVALPGDLHEAKCALYPMRSIGAERTYKGRACRRDPLGGRPYPGGRLGGNEKRSAAMPRRISACCQARELPGAYGGSTMQALGV